MTTGRRPLRRPDVEDLVGRAPPSTRPTAWDFIRRMHRWGRGCGARVSAWLTPDQVASGALSLGYAMMIAALQGMTCDTSLLYGHGANAFATYPGLTRGKKANHLWLPLAVIESEDTRARLGDARTEEERLERAVDAFARYLGQSRPDAMVSDLLHERRPRPRLSCCRRIAHPRRQGRRGTRPVDHRPQPTPARSPTTAA